LNRFKVDGTDFFKSYEIALKAVELARAGEGPSLIEADTIRLLPHSSSDSQIKYRSQEELENDLQNDPIPKFESFLIGEKILTEKELDSLKIQVKKEIDQAAEAIDKKEHPDPETVHHYLFAPEEENNDQDVHSEPNSGDRAVFVDAINHALKEEMSRDENIILFGQDVADGKGGVFTATSGISTMFGKERCFNAPLAESSIVGVATGLAVRGLKPVVEIQFGDYIWTAMMQIRNELSTIRWRSNNHWSSPVIIRVPVGGYIHGGLCHSQNIEAFFSHIPGLKIIYPEMIRSFFWNIKDYTVRVMRQHLSRMKIIWFQSGKEQFEEKERTLLL
jgi:2-oxoisovalerate dehydrogenase E1 component